MSNVKNKKPRRRNYKKRPIRRSAKPSKSFVKKVQSVISKNVESKQVFRSENTSNINASITTANDAYQVLPNMGQGVTDHGRVGDQVKAQRLTIKGHFISNLTYTGSTTCRLGVRMMIVTPKQYGNFGNVQSNAVTWLTLLLKKGATTSAFTGVIPDLYANINTDVVTKHYDKVFYINCPYLQTAVGDTSVYNTCKFFSKTIKLKNKLLKYDSSVDAGLTPVNYSPVLLMGYVRLDGTAPDVTNHINLSYDAYLIYEDA